MDVHIPGQITRALRQRGVDVITAQEDGTAHYADTYLLARVGELRRLLFTMDADFLIEAAQCQRADQSFATIVYTHMRNFSIGSCVDDLTLLTETLRADEVRNQVVFLPLCVFPWRIADSDAAGPSC